MPHMHGGGRVQAKRQPIFASKRCQEASASYRSAFFLFASTAGGVALVVNFIAFLNPTLFVLNVSWKNLVNFLSCTMISTTLILPMVIELRDSGAASPAKRMAWLRTHG